MLCDVMSWYVEKNFNIFIFILCNSMITSMILIQKPNKLQHIY